MNVWARTWRSGPGGRRPCATLADGDYARVEMVLTVSSVKLKASPAVISIVSVPEPDAPTLHRRSFDAKSVATSIGMS